MISRNETIPKNLTDQALQHIVDNGSGLEVKRALTLLGVQPEHRQGVQDRVWRLRTRSIYLSDGAVRYVFTGVSLTDAFAQALSELAEQLADRVV